jgi:hypothetical protein
MNWGRGSFKEDSDYSATVSCASPGVVARRRRSAFTRSSQPSSSCKAAVSSAPARSDGYIRRNSSRARVAAMCSGASVTAASSATRASSGRPCARSARPRVTRADGWNWCRASPARHTRIASSSRPVRRYSSASCAKAIDAGSCATRRSSSWIRESSATADYSRRWLRSADRHRLRRGGGAAEFVRDCQSHGIRPRRVIRRGRLRRRRGLLTIAEVP